MFLQKAMRVVYRPRHLLWIRCPFKARLAICVVTFLPGGSICVCVAHLELGRQFLAQENMCCPFSSLMPVSQTKHTWGCLSSFRVCCTGKISEMLDEIWRFTHMCTPWQWPREKGCKNVPWGQIGWKVLLLQIENLEWFFFSLFFS